MSSNSNRRRTYAFTLRHDSNFLNSNLTTDCFLEITDLNATELSSKISSIVLRLRFNPDMYPHLLSIHGDDLHMTREILESYINNMEVDELTSFLEGSKII